MILVNSYFKGNKTISDIISLNTKLNIYKHIDDINGSSVIDYFTCFGFYQFEDIKTISNHNTTENSLLMLEDGKIASCSNNGYLSIYDSKSDSCLKIKAHHQIVSSLCQLEDGNIVTCSKDKAIKIWNIRENTNASIFMIYSGHDDYIAKVIVLSNNRFASCGYDSKIMIWKADQPYSLNKIKELKIHNDAVKSMIYDKNKHTYLSFKR